MVPSTMTIFGGLRISSGREGIHIKEFEGIVFKRHHSASKKEGQEKEIHRLHRMAPFFFSAKGTW